MMNLPKASLYGLALGILALPAKAEKGNWPDWRGPTSNLVAAPGNYPTTLDPEKNAVWKVALPGYGNSTPCVWGEHIFITCDIEDDEVDFLCHDGVLCYDLAGNEKWRRKLGKQPIARQIGLQSNSNSSPTTDGERVFVYYHSGTVAALDFEGKLQWKVNLQEKYGQFELKWRVGTSPVLAGDNVVIAVMHEGESYLVALEKDSGDVAWRTLRANDKVTNPELFSEPYAKSTEADDSYTTPTVTELDGRKQIVSWGASRITSHSLDGEELWNCGGFNLSNKVIASQSISKGHAVLNYEGGAKVTFVKLGGEGNVSEKARVGDASDRYDWNGSYTATPIAVDGRAYVLTGSGKISCYDITNGKLLWPQFKLPPKANEYNSSPVKAGDHFYFAREDGMIFATRELETGMELVASNKVNEGQTATIVPINNRILVRGRRTLAYFE